MMPQTKAYEVQILDEYFPIRYSYYRAETAGKARIEHARLLEEVGAYRTIGDALKRLRVRRVRTFDDLPSSRQDQRTHGSRFCEGRIPTDEAGQPVRADQAEINAKAWNDVHRIVGETWVRYWTGTREGPGKTGRTRSTAQVVGDTAVVWVEGEPSCIALTHVAVLP